MIAHMYALPIAVTLTGRTNGGLLFRDRAEPEIPELDVLVRSGDYFITLATSLETLATNLPDLSARTAGQLLEKIADELTYAQRHYTITRKNHPDDITELH